jgi:hypothetical protein
MSWSPSSSPILPSSYRHSAYNTFGGNHDMMNDEHEHKDGRHHFDDNDTQPHKYGYHNNSHNNGLI